MDDFNDISNIVEEINCSLVESLTISGENPDNGASKLYVVYFLKTMCVFLLEYHFGYHFLNKLLLYMLLMINKLNEIIMV